MSKVLIALCPIFGWVTLYSSVHLDQLFIYDIIECDITLEGLASRVGAHYELEIIQYVTGLSLSSRLRSSSSCDTLMRACMLCDIAISAWSHDVRISYDLVTRDQVATSRVQLLLLFLRESFRFCSFLSRMVLSWYLYPRLDLAHVVDVLVSIYTYTSVQRSRKIYINWFMEL